MSSVLAQFISDETGLNATDDGFTAPLVANLKSSVQSARDRKSVGVAGTVDAIQATFQTPPISLLDGVPYLIRAAGANTSATPTATVNNGVLAAKTIVKGNNLSLVPGDIPGAGFWIELVYDVGLDKYVLQNPSTGSTITGRLLRTIIITASGTWTKGAGTNSVDVEVLGGGGGGGGTTTTTTGQGSASTGGSAGSYARKFIAAVASPQTVTIGAAGAAGPAGTVGTNGGATSFGALVSCPGGLGGNLSGAAANVYTPGVAGGSSPTGGDINIPGAGTSCAQAVGSIPNSVSSNGANSQYGAGGLGVLNGAGLGAGGYGAGGGGNSIGASTAGQTGGAGTPGLIIVREYA
jgi:hypothetical protein